MISVLGLNSYNENSSAALIMEDKLCGFVQEERFSRVKYDHSFPKASIKFLLQKNSITKDKVGCLIGSIRKANEHRYFVMKGKKTRSYRLKGFHHFSHAASAYRLSSFNKANILVADACGDNNDAITFFYGDNGNIHKVWSIDASQISFGIIYKDATIRTGFQMNDEGKLMGLASYGKPYKNYRDVFLIERHDKIRNKYSEFSSGFKGRIDFDNMPPQESIDFGATIQKCLEESAINLIKDIYQSTKIKNFCFAGGTFLNSKLLGEIAKQPFVDNIFTQPNASDSGLSIGYAVEWAAAHCGAKKFNFNVYSGPSYREAEILKILKKHRIEFEITSDPAYDASKLLKKNKIIGWFQGAMEWGPRALGNRSILANPHFKENIYRVNNIKGREFWRPLAPSFLKAEAGAWLKGLKDNPFMMICFSVTKEKRNIIKAVTHVDGTARAQTVTSESNPLFYSLIKNFYKLTGTPCVLNTSFNYRGEPIVCSPLEAVKSFSKMGLDYLIIHNFIISKKNPVIIRD